MLKLTIHIKRTPILPLQISLKKRSVLATYSTVGQAYMLGRYGLGLYTFPQQNKRSSQHLEIHSR